MFRFINLLIYAILASSSLLFSNVAVADDSLRIRLKVGVSRLDTTLQCNREALAEGVSKKFIKPNFGTWVIEPQLAQSSTPFTLPANRNTSTVLPTFLHPFACPHFHVGAYIYIHQLQS